MDTVILVGYFIGYVLSARHIAATMYYKDPLFSDHAPADLFTAILIGLIGGLLWPIVESVVLVYKLVKLAPEGILGEPRDMKIKRLEKEAQERERRIKELERVNGIK